MESNSCLPQWHSCYLIETCSSVWKAYSAAMPYSDGRTIMKMFSAYSWDTHSHLRGILHQIAPPLGLPGVDFKAWTSESWWTKASADQDKNFSVKGALCLEHDHQAIPLKIFWLQPFCMGRWTQGIARSSEVLSSWSMEMKQCDNESLNWKAQHSSIIIYMTFAFHSCFNVNQGCLYVFLIIKHVPTGNLDKVSYLI